MSAHRIPTDFYDMLANGMATVVDPGDAGVVVVGTKGIAICEVVSVGAETRVLEAAANLPVGTKLTVILKTDGGDVTVTSDDSDVVLTTAGEIVEFTVSVSGSTNVWRNTKVDLPASAGTYALAATNTAADNALAILAIVGALDAAGLIDASGITQA